MNVPPDSSPDLPPATPPSPPVAPRAVAAANKGHAGIGVAIGILTQPLTLLIAFLTSNGGHSQDYTPFIVLAVFGLVQWLYIVPIGIVLHATGKSRTALGLWITAGIIFLINAGCWGLLAIGNW